MPSALSLLPRARNRAASRPGFSLPSGRRLLGPGALLAAVLVLAACTPLVSVENADVPQWRATALPTTAQTVIGDAGKILNRDRIVQEAANVPAGRYTLTATCEGGGKAFFAVSLNGVEVVDAGAACNGSLETTRITLQESGTLEISTSSVDAPLIYAYNLEPAK